jgi:hypothetical protein
MKRRILSLGGLAVLLIAAGFAYWLIKAQAADRYEQPYKWELIEQGGGIKILHGIIDPVLDAHQVFIEKDGKREPLSDFLSICTLTDYVNQKYASESVDAKINHFVRLFNPYQVKLIESVNDIPGYASEGRFMTQQLDPDIHPEAIKSYAFTVDEGWPGRKQPRDYIVKYAWEGMGDLQRFRFLIRKATGEILLPHITVVQRQVGDFGGLD